MRLKTCSITWLALALLACGGDPPKAPPPSKPATPAPNVEAPKPARTLTRADLQQLLDTWLAAQNAGDFAAYEALYAPLMHGVKRVGERESRMDRAQWMQDRARMFKKKMEVEVHSVTFRSLMATAVIEFVQVFHSGKFMDSGPKKLMVALHDGEPRIVHEEMLSSELLLQADAFRDRVYLTIQVGETTYVVLSEKVEPHLGTGDFGAEGTLQTSLVYTQRVNTSVVPRAQQWLDTPLRVYDKAGVACSATITELKVMLNAGEYILDEQDDERIRALPEPAATDQRARAILRDEPAMLTGKLSACSGEIATPATEPEPAFYLPQVMEPAIEQAAIAATKALPQHVELRAQWEKIWLRDFEGDPKEREWDSLPNVDLFGSPAGPRFVITMFGDESCSTKMSEMLLVVFRIDAQGALTLVRSSSQWTYPTLMLDLNADGTPEILSHDALYGLGSYGLFRIKEVRYAYNGCTC